MSPSGADFIRQVKQDVPEVGPSEVNELLHEGVRIIDVRETEEVAAGKLPGATHVPRGFLESRIEGIVPDRSERVLLYCASGNRLALAAPGGSPSPAPRATAPRSRPTRSCATSATSTPSRWSAASRCGRTAATRS